MGSDRRFARRAGLLVATVALVAACTGPPGDSGSAGERSEASSAEAEVTSIVDNTINLYNDETRAVLVHVGDRALVERYNNSSAEETSNVASVTKSVMSILVGIAIDEGVIDSVDQTLADLLPDHAQHMSPELGEVTLHQVLTMTAGLPRDVNYDGTYKTTDNWVNTILTAGLRQPPGVYFEYSSAGSHLLSAILVEATGRSVLDYAREKLFDPIGIDTDPAAEPVADPENRKSHQDYDAASFAWPVDHQGHHMGDSFLKITAPDMGRIGQLMLARGRWHGQQIVSSRWVAESTRAQAQTRGGTRITGEYGYHWWVTTAGGHHAFVAAGFGGQLIEVVPALDLVVVVASAVLPGSHLDPGYLALSLVDQKIAPAIAE
jgi:CubicO group peptidase (beta-lactamase class C family)